MVIDEASVRIEDVPFLTIGGRLASFTLVDRLRIHGIPVDQIRVLGPQRRPYENLRNLLRNSQISDGDLLRSDSASRADNIWGFPGYAIEQAVRRRTVWPLCDSKPVCAPRLGLPRTQLSLRRRRVPDVAQRLPGVQLPQGRPSGQLARRLRRMNDGERARFIASMRGHDHAETEALADVARTRPLGRPLPGRPRRRTRVGPVRSRIDPAAPREHDAGRRGSLLDADFVIDCTGLKPDLRESPPLSDLFDAGAGRLNALGGLDVEPHFEVRGSDSGRGRIYASGVLARGGYLAPIDSFWGCSHAALLICDDLVHRGFCPRLGVTRTIAGWFRWLAGKAP